MDAWVQIIQSVGFPIFAVLACFVYIYRAEDRNKDEAKEREDKLIEANEKVSNALSKVADTLDTVNTRLSIVEAKIDKLGA